MESRHHLRKDIPLWMEQWESQGSSHRIATIVSSSSSHLPLQDGSQLLQASEQLPYIELSPQCTSCLYVCLLSPSCSVYLAVFLFYSMEIPSTM